MGNTIRTINERGGVMYAPDVDTFIQCLDRQCKVSEPETLELLDGLYRVLEKIKPCGDDERRSLWLTAERGPIEAFGDFEEMREYEEVETYEEYEQMWRDFYPEETYWYHLITVEHDGFRAVFLKNREVIEYDPRMPENDQWGEHIHSFIRWLTVSCEKCVDMLAEGTYNQYVSEKLAWRNRTGTILRSDYWKEYQESREYDLEGFRQEDMEEFISLMKDVEDQPKAVGRIREMTANKFYEYCTMGYRANSYKGAELSTKEQYYKFADGRDEGLKEIDGDSPEAFSEWYHDRKRGGGHPWEIVRGGNSTHVDLFIWEDENGSYLEVAGNHRAVEAAYFYLALHRAGVPVTIRNGRALADLFLGCDRIGIVPDGVIPKYCETLFPGEKIIDFMNLHYDMEEKLLKYIKWQDTEKNYLL